MSEHDRYAQDVFHWVDLRIFANIDTARVSKILVAVRNIEQVERIYRTGHRNLHIVVKSGLFSGQQRTSASVDVDYLSRQ